MQGVREAEECQVPSEGGAPAAVASRSTAAQENATAASHPKSGAWGTCSRMTLGFQRHLLMIATVQGEGQRVQLQLGSEAPAAAMPAPCWPSAQYSCSTLDLLYGRPEQRHCTSAAGRRRSCRTRRSDGKPRRLSSHPWRSHRQCWHYHRHCSTREYGAAANGQLTRHL